MKKGAFGVFFGVGEYRRQESDFPRLQPRRKLRKWPAIALARNSPAPRKRRVSWAHSKSLTARYEELLADPEIESGLLIPLPKPPPRALVRFAAAEAGKTRAVRKAGGDERGRSAGS